MIECIVTSQDNTELFKSVENIKLPSVYGQVQILPNHAKSFLLLQEGEMQIVMLNGKEKKINVLKGECFINDNIVTIVL